MKLLLTTYFEGVTPNLGDYCAACSGVCMSILYMVKMTLLNCTSVCLLTGCCLPGLINGRNTSGAPILPRSMRKWTLSAERDLWWHLPAHCCTAPSTLSVETRLDTEVKSWFAFAPCKNVADWHCCAMR
ncbi:hypothetical protein MJ572_19830 [Escherichia coli]|nr:hypothetical protein MJ572_19830 [Escherichia coli]